MVLFALLLCGITHHLIMKYHRFGFSMSVLYAFGSIKHWTQWTVNKLGVQEQDPHLANYSTTDATHVSLFVFMQ
jgi:hypothetical protein